MTNNGAIETIEIERKYEVSAEDSLPNTETFAALGLRLGDAEQHDMRAQYFDTPEADLARQRTALRRREGGKDAGWHLKMKGDDAARELLWPPSDQMPAGVRAELASRIGADATARIGAIATLRTHRTTAILFDEHNNAVIELADDLVDARNELSGREQRWREWEAELMPGTDPARLDAIEPSLVAAGARRVRGTSKIQRTMQAGPDATAESEKNSGEGR